MYNFKGENDKIPILAVMNAAMITIPEAATENGMASKLQ